MANGTAPVPEEESATSGISADLAALTTGEAYWLYIVWPAGPIFTEPRGASEDWKWAKREAKAVGGIVTKQEIVGDFRRGAV